MDRTKPNAAPAFPVQPGPAHSSAPEIVKTTTLMSGKVLTIIRPKGKHQRLALMAAGNTTDRMKIMHAIMGQLIRLDGKIVAMEQFDDMDLGDLLEIEEEVAEFANPLLKRRKAQEASDDSLPS